MSTQTWDAIGQAIAAAYDFVAQGQASVTIGQTLAANLIGGTQGHNFGDYAYLTVDYEGLLKGLLGTNPLLAPVLNGPVGSVLGGLGGGATFTYGRSTTATYVGPSIGITRGPSFSVTGNMVSPTAESPEGIIQPGRLLTWSDADAFHPDDRDDTQTVIDQNAALVAEALSAVMILVALALDIAIYCVMKRPSQDTGPQSLPGLLKDVEWILVTRLMALIVDVERLGNEARDAVRNFTTAANLTDSQKAALLATTGGRVSLWKDMTTRLHDAAEDADKATKGVAIALGIIVGLLALVATVSAAAALSLAAANSANSAK